MNVTLSLDEAVVRKVRKLAIDQHTTMTGLVRSYLETLAQAADEDARAAAAALESTFAKTGACGSGGRRWSRDDLHD